MPIDKLEIDKIHIDKTIRPHSDMDDTILHDLSMAEENSFEMYELARNDLIITEEKKIKQTAGFAGGALLGAAVAGPLGALAGGIAGVGLTIWANKHIE
ncbi:MAG TPA: hypothetical protein DCM27_07825 [Rhodospirillaceae bacterium]|nr:hypothetical protein [Rhodospirillaceae bacterium]